MHEEHSKSDKISSLPNPVNLNDFNGVLINNDCLTYDPDTVTFKSNGLVCVKPLIDFLNEANILREQVLSW